MLINLQKYSALSTCDYDNPLENFVDDMSCGYM